MDCGELLKRGMDCQLSELLLEMSPEEQRKNVHVLYGSSRAVQETVLLEMIKSYRNTEFGLKHHFASIHSIEDYRKEVPLSEYEDYHNAIDRLKKAESDILFPGRATYFFLTSGTSGTHKYIPDTPREEMNRRLIVNLRFSEWADLLDKTQEKYAREFADRIRMALVGKLQENAEVPDQALIVFANSEGLQSTEGGILCGTASSRTATGSGGALRPLYANPPILIEEYKGEDLRYMILRAALPSSGIYAGIGNNAMSLAELAECGQKYADELIRDIREGTCRLAMSENVRTAMGNRLTPLPERADYLAELARKNRFIPKYYWPKFITASFWLGGSVGFFTDRIRQYVPENTRFIDAGYGSSEAKFNVPCEMETPGGPLAVYTNFYEFQQEDDEKILTADELEQGKTYELYVTNNAGLYRYRMHDQVIVDGFTGGTPDIRFYTKSADIGNIAQEKIPGILMQHVTMHALSAEGLEMTAVQVYPDLNQMKYIVCIETDNDKCMACGLKEKTEEKIDEELMENPHYAIYRNNNAILAPEVQWMKKGFGAYLIEEKSKIMSSTSQVKVQVFTKALPDERWFLK